MTLIRTKRREYTKKMAKVKNRDTQAAERQGDGVTAYTRRRQSILWRHRSQISYFQVTVSGFKRVGRRNSDGLDAIQTALEAKEDGVTSIRWRRRKVYVAKTKP